jgi:cellulose synthase (UDP-forming)
MVLAAKRVLGADLPTSSAVPARPREPGLYGRTLAFSSSRLAVARLASLLALAGGSIYLAWRLTTLAGTGALGAVFYAAEVANFLSLALAVVLLFRLRVREHGPPGPPSGTLDVFVTVCGEPAAMVSRTLETVLAIEYPHRTVVLNDGCVARKPGWQEIEVLAARAGVPCLTRSTGPAGKAGNLNHALESSDAELVAVVDADHRVRPDLAHETLGYFADPSVAFVCTPQQFDCAPGDPLNNRELLFYRALQPAKDAANAAFSCGNAVVYRRKALDSVGGFSEWNLVEDLHTSYRMHAGGWRSVYHPRALSTGEAPTTASSLLKQRLVWATDSLRILLFDNPLRKRGLSAWQRLHYLHTTSFYLAALCQTLFLLAPALYLLLGMSVMRFDSAHHYAFASGFYFGSVALFLVAYGGRGGIRAVQQVLFLAPTYVLAFVIAATRVRPRGRVTEKLRPSRFSPIVLPQLALVALSMAGIAVSFRRPEDGTTIAAAWAAWNVVMVAGFMTAVGSSRRTAVGLRAAVRVPAVAAVLCVAVLASSSAPLEPSSDAAAAGVARDAGAGPRALAQPVSGAYLGVFNPNLLARPDAVRIWSRRHGLRPRIVHWYQQWGSGERRLRADWLGMVANQGAIPMITWEPWSKPPGTIHDAVQPRYRLTAIAAGRFDPYIRSWARTAAAYGRPLLLRPMHEMNGYWYPWSITTNGGSPRAFVRAWRRIHRLFQQEGATNVRWVWAVNTFTGLGREDRAIARYYPGDAYVDWVSATGFNWGTSNRWNEWEGLDEVLGSTYRALQRFPKPVMISELATVDAGGDGARWVAATLRRLQAKYPRVKALVWFDARYPGGIDFRLDRRQSRAMAGVVGRSSSYWDPALQIVSAGVPQTLERRAGSS